MLAAQTTTMGARPAFMGMRVTSINVQRSQGQGRVSMRIRAEDEAENKKQSAAKVSPAALRTEFASPEAIQGEVDRLRKEMFTMRIKFAKREEYQPAQYRALKKRVAQLLTIQRERTVDAGVSLREARAAEKRMMVEAGLRQF